MSEIKTLLSKKPLNEEEEKKLNRILPLISIARQNLFNIRLSTAGRRWHNSVLQSPNKWPSGTSDYKYFQKRLEIDELRGPEIDLAQLNFIYEEHNDHIGDEDRLSIAVEGAGPSGLLTAITQFHQGNRVHVFEARDTGNDQAQAVRLDPLWMHTLKFYLGEKYFSLFGEQEGRGRIAEDGFGEIVTTDLEAAMYARFSELNSLVNSNDKLSCLALHKIKSLEAPGEKDKKYMVKAVFNAEKNKHSDSKAVGKDVETVEKEINMLICTDGKNSAMTKKYFKRQAVTNEREYGVTSWQSNGEAKVTNDALDTFSDFRNKLVCKGSFLRKVKARFDSELKKIPMKAQDALQNVSESNRPGVDKTIQGNAWKDAFESVTGMVLQTHTFENKGLIYIGMEIPKEIADPGTVLEKRYTQKVSKAHAEKAKKIFQQAWFQAVGEYYGLEKKGVSDKTMKDDFTAMFPVSHRLEKNVVVEESEDKAQVIITTTGDTKANPHLMVSSGLTGEREYISGLSRFTRNVCIGSDIGGHIELLEENQRTADLVIDRDRIFPKADRQGSKARLKNY